MSWSDSQQGTIPFSVQGNVYQTWYRVFGDIVNSSQPPLVVLHGGPGLSHDSLLPISDLSASRPILFYDQLGNSRSTHLPNKGASFWTVDLFIDELINLLRHFKIEDNYDLLGHSWGGILALEFEMRRKPAGLRRLILTSTLAKMAMWNESNAQLVKTFPAWVQEGMAIGFKDLKVSAPAFKEFRKKHGCRINPFPPEYVYTLDRLFNAETGDPTVPLAMFSEHGELKGWDVIDKLGTVRPPVLLINGRFDVSQQFVNEPMAKRLPKVEWVTFEKSSHSPFWEEREEYMKLIDRFLMS